MTSKFKKILLGATAVLAGSGFALSAGCSPSSSNPINGGGTGEGNGDIQGDFDKQQERIFNAQLGANPSASSKRFDTNVQDKIKIGTTFSSSGSQARALDKVIEKYNELVQSKSADIPAGAKLVEQKNLGSGYEAGSSKVTSDLKSQNLTNFYNLILNYGNVASNLAEYNMLLSFNDELPEYNTDISQFSELFAKANSSIENVKNDSTYLLPFAKSTNVLAINAPVLSYLISEMVKAGAVLATDEDTTNFVNLINQKGEADRNGVIKQWGAARSGVSLSGLTISSETFKNYKDILEFSTKAQELFVQSYNNGNSANATVHVFGVDGSPSLLLQSLYSEINADDISMISYATKVDGVTKVNFGALKNTSSTSYTKTQEIYSAIADAVYKGGLKLFPGGQYSSSDQTKHKIAFSTGSSAGFSHNFISDDPQYIFKSVKIDSDLSSDKKTMVSFVTTDLTNDMVAKLSSYKNPLYKHTYKPSTDAKYDLVFASEADEQAFNEKLSSSQNTNKDLIIKVSGYGDKATDHKELVEEAKKLGYFAGIAKAALKDQEAAQSYILLYIKGGREVLELTQTAKNALEALKFVQAGKDRTGELNRNELIALSTPLKWRKENAKKVIYGQGPSLIGIHANSEDDKATKAFVKWLFTDKKYSFKSTRDSDDRTYELTPSEYFDKFASYITASSILENLDTTAIFADNDYVKVTADLFKLGSKSSDYVVYEEPASIHSATFRKSIEAGFDALQQAAVNRTQQSFNSFIEKISFPAEK